MADFCNVGTKKINKFKRDAWMWSAVKIHGQGYGAWQAGWILGYEVNIFFFHE